MFYSFVLIISAAIVFVSGCYEWSGTCSILQQDSKLCLKYTAC